VLSVFHITLSKNHCRWHTPPARVMSARDTFSTCRVLRPTFAHCRHFLRVPRTFSGGHFTAVCPQGFLRAPIAVPCLGANPIYGARKSLFTIFSLFPRLAFFPGETMVITAFFRRDRLLPLRTLRYSNLSFLSVFSGPFVEFCFVHPSEQLQFLQRTTADKFACFAKGEGKSAQLLNDFVSA